MRAIIQPITVIQKKKFTKIVGIFDVLFLLFKTTIVGIKYIAMIIRVSIVPAKPLDIGKKW